MSTRQGNKGNWRGSSSSRRRPPPKQFAKLKGLLTGVLALILIVGFIYFILLRTYTSKLALIAATTDSTVQLMDQAAENDIAAIQDAVSGTLGEGNIHNWKNETQLTQLQSLEDNVSGLSLTEKNQFLFYVSGQCLEFDGKPYLVPSDFVTATNKPVTKNQLVDLERLLQAIAKSDARVKLLMLDAGQLQYAPRLKTFANSFTVALANSLAKLEESDFYVLVSHSPFQRSQLVRGRQRTLFGWSVERALLGEANLDSDQHISLYELTNFVNGMIQENTVEQIPCLLQAGHGPIASAPTGEAYQLAKFAAVEDESDSKDDAAEGEDAAAMLNPFRATVAFAAQTNNEQPKDAPNKKDSDKKDSDQVGKKDGDSGGDKKGGSKKEAKVDSAKKETQTGNAGDSKTETADSKPASISDKLHKAWQLVDDIKARRVTPIDFAPRHWRHLLAELIHLERAARFSATDVDRLKELEGNVDDHIKELNQLLVAVTKSQAVNGSSDILFSRWNKFLDARKEEAEKAIANAKRTKAVRKYHSYRKALFDAPFLIKLYATLHQSSPSELRVYIEKTAEFAETYRQLAAESPISVDDIDELIAIGDELDENAISLHNQITAKVDAELTALKKAGAMIGRDENAAIPMSAEVESLLASPFLNADQRRKLIEGFDKIPDRYPLPPIAISKPKPFPTKLELANADVRFISDQLNMNFTLLTAADVELASKQRSIVNSISKKPVYGNLAKASAAWEASYLKIVNVENGIELEAALQLMAMSDLSPITLGNNKLPLTQFNLAIDIEQEYRFSQSMSDIAISRTGTTTFSFVVEANDKKKFDNFDWELQFPDINAEVSRAKAIPMQERAADDNWYQQRFEFTIKTKREFDDSSTIARLVDKKTNERQELKVRLPQPLIVTLLAKRKGTNGTSEVSQLRVFGNRTTQFDFELKNESGEERTVNVQFYALPSYAKQSAPGRIPTSLERRIEKARDLSTISDLRLIAEAKGVALPDDAERNVPLKLVGNKSTPSKPKEGEPPPKPQAAVEDTTWGIVCLIEDANTGTRFPPKWLPIRAMRPSEYIRFEHVYNWDTEAMEIKVKLTSIVPSDLADDVDSEDPNSRPIRILWNPLVKRGGKAEARLAANQTSDYVSGTSDPNKRTANNPNRILLDVDNMARMLNFSYLTPQTRNDEFEFANLKRTEHEIYLEKLSTSQGKFLYLGPNYTPFPIPEKGPEIRKLSEFPEAVFPKVGNATADNLIVDFRVDAPPTAFLNLAKGEGITVGWADDDNPKKLFADRAESSTTTIQENGSFFIQSKVTDHRVAIRANRVNIKSILSLKAVTKGKSKNDTAEAVVVFDNERPKIEKLDLARTSLPVGELLEVTIPVQDASSLQSLSIWFDTNRKPGLDEEDGAPPINLLLQNPLVPHARLVTTGNNRIVIKLKTMGLMPKKYALYARVTDAAGLTSDARSTEVTITKPTGSTPGDEATIKFTLQRKIMKTFNTEEARIKFQPGGEMRVGKPIPTPGKRNAWTYTYKVKPANYKIRAELDVSGGATSVAETEVEIKAGETKDLGLQTLGRQKPGG